MRRLVCGNLFVQGVVDTFHVPCPCCSATTALKKDTGITTLKVNEPLKSSIDEFLRGMSLCACVCARMHGMCESVLLVICVVCALAFACVCMFHLCLCVSWSFRDIKSIHRLNMYSRVVRVVCGRQGANPQMRQRLRQECLARVLQMPRAVL